MARFCPHTTSHLLKDTEGSLMRITKLLPDTFPPEGEEAFDFKVGDQWVPWDCRFFRK